MRICICVSGQIRDNTEKPFQSLVDLVNGLKAQGHEVAVVFSIWNELSRKLDGIINFKQLMKIFEADLVNLIPSAWYGRNLWKKLPQLYKTISENESKDAPDWVKRSFPDSIVDSEDCNIMHLAFDREVSDNNSIKMLYKIWRANEVKRRLEFVGGYKFDYVIRVRPDFTIKQINLGLDQKIIYIPNAKADHSALEDTFAMGTSAAIDYYCELFSKSISSSIKWKGIHYMLSNHLRESVYLVKSTQESAFDLRYMSKNSEKLDIADLQIDLNDAFYDVIFRCVDLKRQKNAAAVQQAILLMASAVPPVEGVDKRQIFFTLLHDLYAFDSNFSAALKAIVLADMAHIKLDAQKFFVDHRINYVFDLVIDLMVQCDLTLHSNMIEDLRQHSSNSLVDDLFHNADLQLIATNFTTFLQSPQCTSRCNAKGLSLGV